METYYLKENLFFRECEGRYVFLDVLHNRYFVLTDFQSQCLAMIMGRADARCPPDAVTQYAQTFIKMDILTQDGYRGKTLTSTDYHAAEFSIDQKSNLHRGIRAVDLPIFLLALLSAARLRRLSHVNMSAVVTAVDSWKTKLPASHSDERSRAMELAQRFLAISPYIFTTRDACFFRSLFLLRYLTLHGLTADWVFAVRLCPFAAHCWVEFDHVVLNEDLERTREYSPIMIV